MQSVFLTVLFITIASTSQDGRRDEVVLQARDNVRIVLRTEQVQQPVSAEIAIRHTLLRATDGSERVIDYIQTRADGRTFGQINLKVLAVEVDGDYTYVALNAWDRCFFRVYDTTGGGLVRWPGTSVTPHDTDCDAPGMTSAKFEGSLSKDTLRVSLVDSQGKALKLELRKRNDIPVWWPADKELPQYELTDVVPAAPEVVAKYESQGHDIAVLREIQRNTRRVRYFLRVSPAGGAPVAQPWSYSVASPKAGMAIADGFVEPHLATIQNDRVLFAYTAHGRLYAQVLRLSREGQGDAQPPQMIIREHGAFALADGAKSADFRGEFADGTLELDTVDKGGKRTTYKLVKHDGRYRWEQVGATATAPSTQPATQPGR